MTRGETPAHDFEKKDWSLDTDRSREHGQKRGGGPQGTAPLSIPSIRYQLTAWASIGGGSEGKEERAFMPGSYRTGEQYTPEGGLHGERGKMFSSCTPV